MCLAVPMRVIEVNGVVARCEARGVERDVGLLLLSAEDVAPGEYIAVHLGQAMHKLSVEQAEAAWALYDEMLAADQPGLPSSLDEDAPVAGAGDRGRTQGGMQAGMQAELQAAICRLLGARRPEASICPSEVARAVGDRHGWRALMPEVRRAALELRREGVAELLSRGTRIDDLERHAGPIRIGRGPRFRQPR